MRKLSVERERGVVMNEKMDLYIDDLAENQGVLFTKAVEQGFDLCSFQP